MFESNIKEQLPKEESLVSETKTFLFMPESAYGPTNNCIGIGNELIKRGHRVIFAAESSWEGKLLVFGFEEALFDLEPPAEDDAEQDAGQFWKDYIREISPEFQKPTVEQLETVTKSIWQALIDGAKYAEPRLQEIIRETQPDVIVEDNVLLFPALDSDATPFVRIVSCNPLEIPGDAIPPIFSGLPAEDSSDWASFSREYENTHRDMWEDFNTWAQEQGAEPLPYLEFMPHGDLNLYVYPEELDYLSLRPLDNTWHRIESSVRETEEEIDLPASFTSGEKPLIYFSLGSLGSADVSLMNRVLSVLARENANVIVSMGPLHEEIELAENMFGAEFLPQTKILPLVDLVITHGGNNTVTESMHFGKPMLLLPLFWDQYDNAQRVDECGYGHRLSTYGFTDDELHAAVADVLSNSAMQERAASAGARIRARDGLRRAGDLLEEFALTGKAPVYEEPDA
jgi:MGT family glycosyltransferase